MDQTTLDAHWMPFTANRQFKASPKLFTHAKDMYFTTVEGEQILDGIAGLWCVNAGHCREPIIKAIQTQAKTMDYSPGFQMSHPKTFELANRLIEITPKEMNRVFFTNSGSEAVDTALKMALAYHQAKGNSQRTRLIGREKGYHGVGFGGISVGGLENNRKAFGSLLPGVDHLPHTHHIEHNAYSRGLPQWGEHLADSLNDLITQHDASTIAAVIVEPLAGSAGVLLPPQGYLQRLRKICDDHDILLIFDEVITGFGRLGKPFAADFFGVIPDLITSAKGLSNGAVPMGAVFAKQEIYDTIINAAPNNQIEFFHGYTYSGHPLACAAALAALDIYQNEKLLTRASELSAYWENAVHSLKGLPHVKDCRNLGLVAGIELESRPGRLGERGFEVFEQCFKFGVLVRITADTIALSPPLIIEKQHIDKIFNTLTDVLKDIK